MNDEHLLPAADDAFESQLDAIKIKLQSFEGPLDLLVHLIKKNKVDVYDIPIALITRQYLDYLGLMQELGPTSLRSAVLLTKSGRQEVEYRPDFSAFEIPNEFVVGYGLDYRDAYRNLPYVATLEPSDLDGRPL